MSKTKIYLSGPISGLPHDEARRNFNRFEVMWESYGWEVFNPFDATEHMVTPEGKWIAPFTRNDCMKTDIEALLYCDAVAMLPNWQTSQGAVLEYDIARQIGLPVHPAEQPFSHTAGTRTDIIIPSPTDDWVKKYNGFTSPVVARSLLDEDGEPTKLQLVGFGGVVRNREGQEEKLAKLGFDATPKYKGPFVVDSFNVELDSIKKLHDAKRSDYTGNHGHPLANYKNAAEFAGMPTLNAMFMRLAEKMYRVKSILEKGGEVRVADESLTDTFRDIAIIAILCKLNLTPGSGFDG